MVDTAAASVVWQCIGLMGTCVCFPGGAMNNWCCAASEAVSRLFVGGRSVDIQPAAPAATLGMVVGRDAVEGWQAVLVADDGPQ